MIKTNQQELVEMIVHIVHELFVEAEDDNHEPVTSSFGND